MDSNNILQVNAPNAGTILVILAFWLAVWWVAHKLIAQARGQTATAMAG